VGSVDNLKRVWDVTRGIIADLSSTMWFGNKPSGSSWACNASAWWSCNVRGWRGRLVVRHLACF